MTQEDKDLLLKDLSARLLYGVKGIITYDKSNTTFTVEGIDNNVLHLSDAEDCYVEDFKPYLRPMLSMTEEEKRELQSFYPGCFGGQWLDIEKGTIDIFECSSTITLYLSDSERIVDWFNKNMFDYRGLIEKGLALEAP